MFRRVGSLSASLLYKKTYPKMEEACLEKKVVCKRENSYLEKFKRDMSGERDLLGEGIILEKKDLSGARDIARDLPGEKTFL